MFLVKIKRLRSTGSKVYYLTSVCFNILMRVKGEFTNYNEDKMKNKSLAKELNL